MLMNFDWNSISKCLVIKNKFKFGLHILDFHSIYKPHWYVNQSEESENKVNNQFNK